MPSEGVTLTPNTQLLSQDEIIKIAQIFVSEGVTKVSPSLFPCFPPISSCHQIRLTGGEPLVRSDVVEIVRRLKNISGLETVAMTTNGVTLARKLPALKEAGLDAINLRFFVKQKETSSGRARTFSI